MMLTPDSTHHEKFYEIKKEEGARVGGKKLEGCSKNEQQMEKMNSRLKTRAEGRVNEQQGCNMKNRDHLIEAGLQSV